MTKEYKVLGKRMAPKWFSQYKIEVFLDSCDAELRKTRVRVDSLKRDSLATRKLCMDIANKLHRISFEFNSNLHCLTSELLVFERLGPYISPSIFGEGSSSSLPWYSRAVQRSAIHSIKEDIFALKRQIQCSQRNLVNTESEKIEDNKYLQSLMKPAQGYRGSDVFIFYPLANKVFEQYVMKLNQVSSDNVVRSFCSEEGSNQRYLLIGSRAPSPPRSV